MCFQLQNIFWKNIKFAFDFDEKTYGKDFLHLHFAVDQLLSISGYDLENRKMLHKQKY